MDTLASLPTTTSLPWWRTDDYSTELALLPAFETLAGPRGVALVRAWPDGRTDQGWGLNGPKSNPGRGFMPRYLDGEFLAAKALHGYDRDRWAFAIVMRSVRMICVDIDGKNGGLEHAQRLGALPPTMAETSKSGDGYHLFYEVDDLWDADKGYDLLADSIGIEQGVDIRAVGCVYHHKQQRWNDRGVSKLPDFMLDLLMARRQRQEAAAARVAAVAAGGDEIETLLLHDELKGDLQRPITAGKRNTTLFAIGQKMKAAGYPDWEQAISDRADEIGLPGDEIAQLVTNIQRYN